jgi:hypothetical protein
MANGFTPNPKIAELAAELDKAYTARNRQEINRLEDAIQVLVKADDLKAKWYEENKEDLKELVDALKAVRTLDGLKEVIQGASKSFRLGVTTSTTKTATTGKKAKGSYKWDASISKNRLVDASGSFVEPAVLMRGRYAGIPVNG